MNSLDLTINKPLSLKFPAVYRYLDKEWIDLFFETGKLRISSFRRFREFPDEIRGDKGEGSGAISASGPDTKFNFNLMGNLGRDGYMMSSSLRDSPDLEKQFKTNSRFLIADPLNFAVAISNALAGCNHVFLGFCNYQKHRVVEKVIEGFSAKDFTNKEGNFIIGGPGMNKRMNEMVGSGIDLMYLKTEKYIDQVEFRFVWSLNEQFFKTEEFLDIEAKEAIQFCKRIPNREDPTEAEQVD